MSAEKAKATDTRSPAKLKRRRTSQAHSTIPASKRMSADSYTDMLAEAIKNVEKAKVTLRMAQDLVDGAEQMLEMIKGLHCYEEQAV